MRMQARREAQARQRAASRKGAAIKSMKLLVTGGAGFIGSSFVRYVLGAREDANIVNFDLLTYAGNLRNIEGVAGNSRYQLERGDIADRGKVKQVFEDHRFDAVVNFAAET